MKIRKLCPIEKLFLCTVFILIIFGVINVHLNDRIISMENQKNQYLIELERLQKENKLLEDKINQLKQAKEGRFFKITTTAYTWTGYKTATGVWPKVERTIAVDPDLIPYGSRVWIEGYGWRIAEDHIGTSVRDNYIDIYMDSKEEALKHGVKELYVFVEE